MTELSESRKISLSTLRAVAEVMRTRSLTKTAALLGISQPAVSSHIKRFEESMGYAPIKRIGNEMVVTSDEVFSIVNKMLILEKELRSIAKQSRLTAPRIGICTSIANYLINVDPKCELFSNAYQVSVDTEKANEELYLSGGLELMLKPIVESEEANFKHRLAFEWTGKVLPANSAAESKIILPSESNPLGAAARKWLYENDIKASIIMEVDDLGLAEKISDRLGAVTIRQKRVREPSAITPGMCSRVGNILVPIGLFYADKRVSYLEAEKCFNKLVMSLERSVDTTQNASTNIGRFWQPAGESWLQA